LGDACSKQTDNVAVEERIKCLVSLQRLGGIVKETKKKLYLPSCKHAVHPRFRVATALMVQIPGFRNTNPCRSVTINRFFGETY